MKYLMCLILLVPHKINAQQNSLPDYIQPCDFNDKALVSCVRQQMEQSLSKFVKGVPELGIESMDPLDLDDVIIDEQSLKLKFEKSKLHGVGTSQITDLVADVSKDETDFFLGFKANFSMTAVYTAEGRILILPIEGHGDSLIEARNCQVNITAKLKHVQDKKSYSHLKMTSPSYTYDIESTTFKLDNLFNGNKELADTTMKFANENWRQLMDDLAPDVIKQIVSTAVKCINKLFSKVPLHNMVLNFPESK